MAIGNLPNFKDQLKSFTEIEVPNKMMKMQLDVAFYLIQKIQEKTPIDTGFAVSNWRMSVDTIPEGTLGTYKGAKYHMSGVQTKGANAKYRFTKERGSARTPRTRTQLNVDALYKSVKGDLVRQYFAKDWNKIGHVLHIFNNVKYIQALENGHSKRAPKGMVRISIEETRVWMKQRGW